MKVLFPFRPTCRFLKSAKKNEFLEDVNRESATTKLTEFINVVPSLIEFLTNNISLYKNYLTKFLLTHTPKFKNANFMMALLVNLSHLITIKHKFCSDKNGEAAINMCLLDFSTNFNVLSDKITCVPDKWNSSVMSTGTNIYICN